MGSREEILRDFIQSLIDNGATQTSIGDSIGYNRTQIYKFVKNNGKVSDEFLNKVEELKTRYEAENQEETEVAATKEQVKSISTEEAKGIANNKCINGKFILTRDAKNIMGICKLTKDRAKFTAVLGGAGTGKTVTVEEFVKNSNGEAIYIRCFSTWKKKKIIQKVGQKLGFTFSTSDESDMLEELAEFLLENPVMIIFDEVDQIVPPKTVAKLETIRNLYDLICEGGSGIMLIGSPRMKAILEKRTENENYGQIDSRINFTYVTQGLTEEESRIILSEYNMTEDAKEALIEKVIDSRKGGLRILKNVLDRCVDLVGDEIITKQIVRNAIALML